MDEKSTLRVSFVTGGPELRIVPVSTILSRVQSGPVWDVASIAPVDNGFPRLHIEWHGGNGFVIQCYEDEHSWSDFLLAGPSCGPPAVEINLVGARHLNDGRRNCSFLRSSHTERWSTFSTADRENRSVKGDVKRNISPPTDH